MVRHHSPMAKHHPFFHHSPQAPKLSSSPTKKEKNDIPVFWAWPSYLLGKLINPWRSNVMSVVSQDDSWRVGNRIFIPKSESKETEKEYRYLIDLPGVKRSQIELHFHNGVIMLRVEASKKARRFRQVHSIRRAFSLPVYTNAEAIVARLKDGVLTIAIPKTDRPVSSKSNTIEIL